MNKLQRLNRKVAWATVALVLAATAFIASVCYAWFAISSNSEVSGVNTEVVGEGLRLVEYSASDTDGDIITYPVAAVRHFTAIDSTGSVPPDQKTVYSVDKSGNLSIEAIYNYKSDSDWEEDTTTDQSTFYTQTAALALFNDMQPGDYVDITLNFYITDSSLSNGTYTIALENFNSYTSSSTSTDNISYTFKLKNSDSKPLVVTRDSNGVTAKETTEAANDATEYGTLGLFKCGVFSADSSGTVAPTSYKFLREFSAYDSGSDAKDSSFSFVVVEDGNLGEALNTTISVTFRIEPDFTQYYALLEETRAVANTTETGDYTIYGKSMTVGAIVISAQAATDNNTEGSE